MKKVLLVIAVGSLFVSGSAVAEDKAAPAAPAAHGEAKYGLAGCGLGSVFFGKGLPVLAATTNGTFGNQTFGITSGTSNCTDTAGGTASTKAFIETNREALAKDIARGRGETVESLATLAGCSDAKAVGSKLQKSFKTIFPTQSVSTGAVSDSIIGTLKGDSSLACGKIVG